MEPVRKPERVAAAGALGACLFLPYYIEFPRDPVVYLQLLVYGGPVPIWSSVAVAAAAVLLLASPRRALLPTAQWLAAWCVGLVLLAYGRALGEVPWWPWVAALLAGIWAVSIPLRARRQDRHRTDPAVFD